jgi:hypothetical protein
LYWGKNRWLVCESAQSNARPGRPAFYVTFDILGRLAIYAAFNDVHQIARRTWREKCTLVKKMKNARLAKNRCRPLV